jgi:hypothetical protein
MRVLESIIMKRIHIISFLLFPIVLQAGQSNSTPKDQMVKVMVEILRKTAQPDSTGFTHEPLAHVYIIYNERTRSGGPEHNQPSNDMQYRIPVFGPSYSNAGGIKKYRIDFEAIHDPKPPKEEDGLDEDSQTTLDDQFEQQCRVAELLQQSQITLRKWQEPIAKDNREFSLNEFQEYQTCLPNIVVKAGAYTIENK